MVINHVIVPIVQAIVDVMPIMRMILAGNRDGGGGNDGGGSDTCCRRNDNSAEAATQ